jgi:hypothetical protein
MNFALKITAGIATITICAILLMFSIPAYATHNANPTCTTVQEDVDHLADVLKERNTVGKVWLWDDGQFVMIIAASPLFPKGTVVLSFYGNGCLMPNPITGNVRTTMPVKDKIKAYIAKSKLFWSNTDKVLLTSAGFAI